MTSPAAHPDDPLAILAKRFTWSADHVFRGNSPLYEHLARGAAADPDLLALSEVIPANQPTPNVLFGVVHYLLLGGTRHRAANYFPSVGGTRPPEEAFLSFRAFCLEHTAMMRPLLETCRVQTNEARRCACLLPVFEIISRCANRAPLDLIEIGPSVGLNLLWDRYAYDYGPAGKAGDPSSPVRIVCEPRGDLRPPIPSSLPAVASRMGIDLEPGDVSDADQMRWQRALIWPDQPERAALFEAAVELARRAPPRIVQGDALDELPALLDALPTRSTSVVYHSFVLNQLAPEARQQLDSMMLDRSAGRALFRVSVEWYSGDKLPSIRLFTYRSGAVAEEYLADCHQHGQWISWLVADHDS